MANLDFYLEAEKRGILPESKKPFLEEARKRGLVPSIKQEPLKEEQTASFDPMGMPTGMTETAPSSSTMPYFEQMRKLGAVGRGAAYGVPAAVLGLPGDIESLGRAGINLAAGGMGYKAPVSPESKLPTTERVGQSISKAINPIFGFKGGKEEELGKIFGETAGSFIGPEVLVKGAGKVAETAIGRASLRGAKVAEKAEQEGFRVSAPQAKSKDPVGVPMSPKEQLKMNEKVTAETGKPTKDVSSEYVKERLTDLGKEYDKIYNRTFQIDESIARAASDILSQERDIAAAGDSGVASIARNISDRFEKAKAEAMEKVIQQMMSGQKSSLKRGTGGETLKTFGPGEPVIATVDGDSLRRMRSYIATRAAEHPDGNIRYQARQLLKQIDGAIEKSNPKVAKQLQETNKKYRATLALKELRMMNDPSIEAGNISPIALGKLLERDGADLSHPLSKYGEFGTALRMRSMTEGAEPVSDPIRSLLSLSERKTKALLSPLSYPLGRTRRAIQRQMAPGEAPPFVAGSKTAGAITAAELQQLIEEQQKKGR